MRRFAAVAAMSGLLSGCALQTASVPRDPMEGLGTASPYRDLTLAVIYSQNTKEGLAFRQDGLAAQPGFQPAAWFDRMIAGLGRGFKRTIKVDNFDDAAASNADLVAVVDDLATFGRAGAKLDVKLSAIFTTLDKRPIDVVVGENDKGKTMWTRGAMAAAAEEAQRRFDAALARSGKLAEFTQSKPGRPAFAAAEAAAPPRTPASDVDEVPAARAPAKPNAFAVVIGVARYRQKLPAAEFADRDARLVAKYLRALGYPDANVATLIDDEATKADFEKYFERWLPNHAGAGSEVFVYYSGHGAPDVKNGDAYLVPYDGDPTYIAETGYPLKKLYAQLAKLPAAKITVVMDSCFSGAGGRSVVAAGARPLVTVAQTDVPGRLTVISASAADQISNSYQARGHGLFTYYFLKGLQEKGADLRAVYDYLKPEVSGYARRELNADQEPQWRGNQ